ncbi:MAG: hypothetical protein ABI222_16175 [Opitutaceae bacterium]
MILQYGIYPIYLSIALIAIASARIWIRERSLCSLLMTVGALIHLAAVILMVIAGSGIANRILVPVGLVLFSVSFPVWAFRKTEKVKA